MRVMIPNDSYQGEVEMPRLEDRRVRTLGNFDPLADQWEGILKKIFEGKTFEVLECVPDIDFLVKEYLPDLVEYWRLKSGLRVAPEKEEELKRYILEKIDMDREEGERIGFSEDALNAIGRVVAKSASKPEGVDEWKERLRKALPAKVEA